MCRVCVRIEKKTTGLVMSVLDEAHGQAASTTTPLSVCLARIVA